MNPWELEFGALKTGDVGNMGVCPASTGGLLVARVSVGSDSNMGGVPLLKDKSYFRDLLHSGRNLAMAQVGVRDRLVAW